MPTATTKPKTSAATTKTDHPSGDNRFKIIDRTLKRFQFQQDALIEVLHTAQETFGFLSNDLLIYVARQLRLPLSWVYGVATFYHFFSLKPQGEHNCTICLGTACYVKNATELIAMLRTEYGIDPGQMTPDKQFSVSTARCLGSCGLAPVVLLDGNVVGRAQAATLQAQVHATLHPEASSEHDQAPQLEAVITTAASSRHSSTSDNAMNGAREL